MTLQERLTQAEQTFQKVQSEREEYLKKAEDNQIEMYRLQGEHRIISELIEEQSIVGIVVDPEPYDKSVDKPNKLKASK